MYRSPSASLLQDVFYRQNSLRRSSIDRIASEIFLKTLAENFSLSVFFLFFYFTFAISLMFAAMDVAKK